MAAQDVLQRTRYEEDLLDQAEFLAALGAVIRIEHLRDDFARVALMHGLDIAAAIEGTEVELGCGLGFPEAEEIDATACEAGDRDIPRHAKEVAGLDEFGGMITTVVGAMLDAAVERHTHAIVRATDQPRVVVGQPVIGDFDLTALREGLAEEAELIMNAITDRRDIHRGEGIEEAGGEATQPAVTKTHVGFFVGDDFEVLPEVGQGRRCDVAQLHVDQVVGQHAAHQVLKGKIIDAADILAGVLGLRVDVALQHLVAGRHAGGHPPVVAGGGDAVTGESALQVTQDRVAENGDRRISRGLGLGLLDRLRGGLTRLDHLSGLLRGLLLFRHDRRLGQSTISHKRAKTASALCQLPQLVQIQLTCA